MEYYKCSNCKGTGLVPTNKGGKKYTACPICKGTGKKKVKKREGGNNHGDYKTKGNTN